MILVVDCGSNKTRFITQIIDDQIDVEEIGIFDMDIQQLDKYIGFVVTGAPILITETDVQHYIQIVEEIVATGKPILGICFGHQLIGLHFNAIPNRIRPIRDMETISILTDSALFNRLPEEIQMMEDHTESISIPPGFVLLATSDSCVNEAMMKEGAPIFGVQFHPEVSGNHGSIVIGNFVNICLEYDTKA